MWAEISFDFGTLTCARMRLNASGRIGTCTDCSLRSAKAGGCGFEIVEDRNNLIQPCDGEDLRHFRAGLTDANLPAAAIQFFLGADEFA